MPFMHLRPTRPAPAPAVPAKLTGPVVLVPSRLNVAMWPHPS
eukprot:CAMPEP_0182570892 /NCGR_PEP_ID=MMETSP1324-20130603/11065_1 /TAXON_ID=236786 /ORGANISM="Florenciella sp., Strain RCC1587" /LENGTH=41 /DNA_ID= /DNA_START= /DNA_END= /DNA_ORIENTATION=